MTSIVGRGADKLQCFGCSNNIATAEAYVTVYLRATDTGSPNDDKLVPVHVSCLGTHALTVRKSVPNTGQAIKEKSL